MKWIPVNNKLPKVRKKDDQNHFEVSERVLVVTKGGDVYIAECEIDDGNYEQIYWTDDAGELVKNVTHWMELPQKPKE